MANLGGLLLSGVLIAACANDGTLSMSSFAPNAAASATAADLAFCVQDINAYRARVGIASRYSESAALETFAALGAQQDSVSGQAHGHFEGTLGGAVGENELLNGSFTTGIGVQAAIQSANAQFFSEGPGGGHYEHLVSLTLRQVGCGVYIANGRITIVEDFQ